MNHPADRYVRLPLTYLLTPADGRLVCTDSWWLVTDDDEVLFYKGSPQCNSDVCITERLRPMYPFHTRSKWIEVAYLPHRCSDYTFS